MKTIHGKIHISENKENVLNPFTVSLSDIGDNADEIEGIGNSLEAAFEDLAHGIKELVTE